MNRLTPEQAGNKSGLVGDVDFAARREVASRDHAGARRRRADDDRDAAAQHAAGGPLQASPDSLLAKPTRTPHERRPGWAPMSLRRLRVGELLALVGAACVIVSLLAALV